MHILILNQFFWPDAAATSQHLTDLVRHLAGDRIQDWPIVRATRDSFDYQWRNLPEGEAMPSNPAWKSEVGKTICRFADFPEEWFIGKKVMDAGCGLGRWTYGFGTLGGGRADSRKLATILQSAGNP